MLANVKVSGQGGQQAPCLISCYPQEQARCTCPPLGPRARGPEAKIPFKAWQRGMQAAGGQLAVAAEPGVTHRLLAGGEPPGEQLPAGQQAVHYTWLEESLRRGQRLPEDDYRQAPGQPAPGQLSLQIGGSTLHVADLQQLLLNLLTGGPRPQWLAMQVSAAPPWIHANAACRGGLLPAIIPLLWCVQGRPAVVVMVMIPGIDQATLSEKRLLLPNLRALSPEGPITLEASSKTEVPAQTLAALCSVPVPAGAAAATRQPLPASAGVKRKPPEEAEEPGAGGGDQMTGRRRPRPRSGFVGGAAGLLYDNMTPLPSHLRLPLPPPCTHGTAFLAASLPRWPLPPGQRGRTPSPTVVSRHHGPPNRIHVRGAGCALLFLSPYQNMASHCRQGRQCLGRQPCGAGRAAACGQLPVPPAGCATAAGRWLPML